MGALCQVETIQGTFIKLYPILRSYVGHKMIEIGWVATLGVYPMEHQMVRSLPNSRGVCADYRQARDMDNM